MRYDFIILMNASIQCNNLFLFCIYLSWFSWLGMRYILLLCNISISTYGESPKPSKQLKPSGLLALAIYHKCQFSWGFLAKSLRKTKIIIWITDFIKKPSVTQKSDMFLLISVIDFCLWYLLICHKLTI